MESKQQLVQIVPPNEVIVLISFELALGELRGMRNLCIPFNSLERVSNKLSSNSWIAYGRRESSSESRKQVGQTLRGSVVELCVHLAETKISTGDMIGMRVGDIITTDKDVHTPVTVSVEGVEKFQGRVGAFKGRKAIQIDGPLTPPAGPQTTAPAGQQP